MSDPNRPEPAGAAPARETQREGGGQQQREGGAQQSQQHAEQQQRGGLQNQVGRRGMRRRHGGPREGQPQQQSSYASRADASINMDELRELFGLIAAQGFTEFELEKEGFRVRLRRDLAPQPGSSPTGSASTHPQIHSTQFAQLPATTPAQTGGGSASQTTQAGGGERKGEEPAPEVELEAITSPIVGTFYRAASPTAEPFVSVGSTVGPETVVCIVEAMKLMNEILAEKSGTIEKVYVENGQPVEFGQPLFGIRK
jgi:acetyl-CoA carboxylase biotin carboxyl carrier protein